MVQYLKITLCLRLSNVSTTMTKECLIWYYRDTNSNEIDLVIESDGMLHPIEIKRTASPGTELIKPFKLLDKASVPRGKGAIICMKETLSAVDSDNYIVPIWMI